MAHIQIKDTTLKRLYVKELSAKRVSKYLQLLPCFLCGDFILRFLYLISFLTFTLFPLIVSVIQR